MKVSYFSDTDSLYIELSERPSAESEEVAPGVVVDFDKEGRIVGIDVDQASKVSTSHDWTPNLFPCGRPADYCIMPTRTLRKRAALAP